MLELPEVPEAVAAGVELRWPDRAAQWIASAPEALRDLCARYNAKPRTVLNARYGFVVAADSPHGGLVFRSSPDPDGPIQAKVAAALADLQVAPAIHDVLVSDVDTWTVMDEVQPGTPLAFADRDAIDLENLVAPFAAMQGQPVPVVGMPSAFDWLRARLEDDDLTELPPWMEPASREDRLAAVSVLDDLAQDVVIGLCHGDASTWNVLDGGQGRWALIDPRGVSGDVTYDAAVLAFKAFTGGRRNEFLTALVRETRIGRDRVRAWMRVVDIARV